MHVFVCVCVCVCVCVNLSAQDMILNLECIHKSMLHLVNISISARIFPRTNHSLNKQTRCLYITTLTYDTTHTLYTHTHTHTHVSTLYTQAHKWQISGIGAVKKTKNKTIIPLHFLKHFKKTVKT